SRMASDQPPFPSSILYPRIHALSSPNRQPALRASLAAGEEVIPAARAMRMAVGAHLGAMPGAEEEEEDHRAEGEEHDTQARDDAHHRRQSDKTPRPAGDDDVARNRRQQLRQASREEASREAPQYRVFGLVLDIAPEQHAPADPAHA